MSAGIVVDASAIVDLVTASPRAERVWQRLRDTDLHAPAHVDAEVLSALARLLRANEITESRAETALVQTVRMPVTRHALAGSPARCLDSTGHASYHRFALRRTGRDDWEQIVVTTDRRLAASLSHRAGVLTPRLLQPAGRRLVHEPDRALGSSCARAGPVVRLRAADPRGNRVGLVCARDQQPTPPRPTDRRATSR